MMRSLVSIDDLGVDDVRKILVQSAELKRQFSAWSDNWRTRVPWSEFYDVMRHRLMASLFYEPSTRTRLSFESAWCRLGGRVIGTESAGHFSSAVKGESLEDTVRIVAEYADLIVLRHPERGAARRAHDVPMGPLHGGYVPIINAGDGEGEHPTQALLDVFTIAEECRDKYKDYMTLTLVGDLRRGRTVHSLLDMIKKVRNTNHDLCGTVVLVAPPSMQLDDTSRFALEETGLNVRVMYSLNPEVVAESDVVYMTRAQKERMTGSDYPIGSYQGVLTPELATNLKKDAVVLHPLPRNEELPSGIDSLPQARYFEQARNGLFVRMAVILWCMG